jgi:hypothetical protein
MLYPERLRFHRTEVRGFRIIVVRDFPALGNREQVQPS